MVAALARKVECQACRPHHGQSCHQREARVGEVHISKDDGIHRGDQAPEAIYPAPISRGDLHDPAEHDAERQCRKAVSHRRVRHCTRRQTLERICICRQECLQCCIIPHSLEVFHLGRDKKVHVGVRIEKFSAS